VNLVNRLNRVDSGLSMTPEDVLHAIFDLQLAFLERGFFELFGFRKVLFGGELAQSIFELVMLGKEVVEFFIRLQQLILQVARPIHARLLDARSRSAVSSLAAN
jgi:hypothetical protein